MQSFLGYLGPLPAIWLAALGLVIGSFLNVVIARVPEDLSIVRPGSRCPLCGHTLSWYENIPVLSYLALGGKCRSCKAPISARYPLVEILTAMMFLACLRRFGWDYELAPALMLVTLLIPLTFIDAEHWILPFALTLPGIALGVLMSIPMGLDRVIGAVIGAAAGFVAFRAMEFFGWLAFRKEALGAGDKFLLALIGAFLTYRWLFAVVFLSALQGSLFGGIRLLFTGRAGPPPTPAAGEPVPDEPAAAEPPPPTMTWAFLKPALPLWRRLVLFPYSVFLQPIPDDPVDVEGEEVEWAPGATNLPFGPWIALAAVELLLLGPWIGSLAPLRAFAWLFAGQL